MRKSKRIQKKIAKKETTPILQAAVIDDRDCYVNICNLKFNDGKSTLKIEFLTLEEKSKFMTFISVWNNRTAINHIELVYAPKTSNDYIVRIGITSMWVEERFTNISHALNFFDQINEWSMDKTTTKHNFKIDDFFNMKILRSDSFRFKFGDSTKVSIE